MKVAAETGPQLDGIVFDTPSNTKVVVAVVDRGRGPVFRTVHPRTLSERARGRRGRSRAEPAHPPHAAAHPRRRPRWLRAPARAGPPATRARRCTARRASSAAPAAGMTDSAWPALHYEDWSATCDTLHAHTQVLGKLAVALAPPEPQLQHAALRLTARGWETNPLPAPDGSGALVAALDLRTHEAIAEHSDGGVRRVPLDARPAGRRGHPRAAGGAERARRPGADQPDAAGGPVDRAARRGRGARARYDPAAVADYFTAATQAALVLAEFRAPYRGRSTPVNAWWGSFDLAVNLFSGAPADPPSDDFIMRNAMDAQEVAVGWWPGDPRYGKAAFYAYAHPAPDGFEHATLEPAAARWEPALGEFILDWEDVRAAPDPHAAAMAFARSAFRHSCAVCEWDPALPASAEGDPPPIR